MDHCCDHRGGNLHLRLLGSSRVRGTPQKATAIFITMALKTLVQVIEKIRRLFPITIQKAHLGQVSIGEAKQKLLCEVSLKLPLCIGSWVDCTMKSFLLSLPTRPGPDWFHQLSNCLPQVFGSFGNGLGVRSLVNSAMMS